MTSHLLSQSHCQTHIQKVKSSLLLMPMSMPMLLMIKPWMNQMYWRQRQLKRKKQMKEVQQTMRWMKNRNTTSNLKMIHTIESTNEACMLVWLHRNPNKRAHSTNEQMRTRQASTQPQIAESCDQFAVRPMKWSNEPVWLYNRASIFDIPSHQFEINKSKSAKPTRTCLSCGFSRMRPSKQHTWSAVIKMLVGV